MKCDYLKLPDGGVAIVCSPGRRNSCYRHRGTPSTFQCDWKLDNGTCDRYLCEKCALEVAPEKHLCPQHQEAYTVWQANQRQKALPIP